MRRHKARATAGSVSAPAGAGAVSRCGFRGQPRLCVKFRAGDCLTNPEPDLEKNRLRATAHLSTLVESWSGPRWAGVSENGSEGSARFPQSLPGDLAMRSTPRSSELRAERHARACRVSFRHERPQYSNPWTGYRAWASRAPARGQAGRSVSSDRSGARASYRTFQER